MKTAVNFREALFDKAQYYILLLFVFLMPFTTHGLPPVIIALIVVWLLGSGLHEKLRGIFTKPIALLMVIFYLLHVVGMLYTENIMYGLIDLEGKLALVLFPVLVFGSSDYFKEKFVVILKCFVLANFISSLIEIIYALYKNIHLHSEYNTYMEFSMFLHPSYGAMYVLFSIGILIYFLSSAGNESTEKARSIIFSKPMMIFMIFVLFVAICFYSSKAGLLATSVFFFIAMGYLLFKTKIRLYAKLLIVLAFIGILIFAFKENLRIRNFINFLVSHEQVDYQSTSSEAVRYIITIEAMDLVQQHFLTGVGTGDVKDALMKRYTEKNIIAAKLENLNAHNQYMETVLGLGIVAGILLIVLTFHPLFIGIISGNILLLCFAICIIINFLFESMLNTQAGVVFFAFFGSLMINNGAFPVRLKS